jgi:sec-independent protein translocase protein TatC
MKFGTNQHADPDDFFSDTRMGFGDHLEDLRLHLWRAIAGFLIALVAGFAVGRPVLQFISAPVKAELKAYWDKYDKRKHKEVQDGLDQGSLGPGRAISIVIRVDGDKLKQDLGIKTDGASQPVLDVLPSVHRILHNLDLDDWVDSKHVSGGRYVLIQGDVVNSVALADGIRQNNEAIGARKEGMSTLNVQEAFMVYVKVSIVTGLVLASPWIFYQIWAFVAAGLYPHEKRYVNVFLPVSIGLFLAGVFLCEFVVIPRAVGALLWFNEWLQLEPDLRLNEWLSFAIFMPLIFGVSFQTPLVMLFLERINIFTVETFRAKRRIAWFGLAVIAAVITPATDAYTMLFLWVPMSLLYELGILMCVYWPKPPAFDVEVPESEELIEV